MKIAKFTGSRPMRIESLEFQSEDSDKLIDPEKDPIMEDLEDDNLNAAAIISELVRREWEICDMINGYKVSLQDGNNPDLLNLLDEILTDHYADIGQLESQVQDVVPEAEAIRDDEQIKGDSEDDYPEDELVEPEGETVEEPEVEVDDDIPSDLLDTEDK